MSTPLHVINSEYWIRVNLALEHCIKNVLIGILHNIDNDPSYNGLPTNPTQLYNEMLKCQNNKSHTLHKVINNDQWKILCPANQQTNSKDFDITLLVAVIRSVIGLKPLGGWKIKALLPNDNSKGAFVFLCRNLRNDVKHCAVDDIKDLAQFQAFWIRIEHILIGLNFKDMASFYLLKTCPLDKYVDAIVDMVNDLKKEINLLRNEASDNSDSIKNMYGTINLIQNTISQISSTKADKSDVAHALSLKADKEDLSLKADKKDLSLKADKKDLSFKADKKDLDEVVEKMNANRGNFKEKQPIRWNVYETVPNFYGREKVLETIYRSLQTSGVDAMKPVILHGMGGIGKTQIASMYIKKHEDLYFNIISIDASNLQQSLNEVLQSCFNSIIPANASIECLSQILSRHLQNDATIFVINDLEISNIEAVQKLFRNLKFNFNLHYLVTTQIGNLDFDRYNLIHVQCFDAKESISFLQQELRLEDANINVKDLAAILQGFPLAMQQAICYIKKYKTPIVDYVRQFNENNKRTLGLNLGKSGYSEYEKTLLTVWQMAFEKLRSNFIALNVLGMMAYMDPNHINRKTFLYYDGINEDEFKLNEVVELLSEFSLIHVNGDKIEIHPLVQKIIRLSINDGLMTFKEPPFDLLKMLLFQFISLFQKDRKSHTDGQSLWYPHFCRIMKTNYEEIHDLSFFIQVALNRNDAIHALRGLEVEYNRVLSYYNETKDFNIFIKLVEVHRLQLRGKILLHQISAKDLMSFERKFEKELKSTHPMIMQWKIQQAISYYHLNKVVKYRNLLLNIYNQVLNENMEYNSYLLLSLAEELCGFDVRKSREILNKCDFNLAEDDKIELRTRIFKINCEIAIRENSFSIAEEILMKFKKMLTNTHTPPNHQNYSIVAELTIMLSLKRQNYNDALQKAEESVAVNPLWLNRLRSLKVIALVKLNKLGEAFSLLSELPVESLDLEESQLLAYIKFLRHDFDGIYKLLDNEFEMDKDLCYWIQLYAMTLAEVNRKRGLVGTSFESLNKLVENCVKSKMIIIALFDFVCCLN